MEGIVDTLKTTGAGGDKTILDVFGEKSKDFDDMIPSGKNIFGQEVAPLSQIELLEMIMPFAGSIRGGKQALGNFKFLSKNWDILGKKLKGDVAGLSSKSIAKKNINLSKVDQEFADAYEEFMKFHAKAPKSAWKEVSPKKVSKPDWEEFIGKPSKLTPRESANKKHFEELMDLIDPSHPTWKRQKLSSMEATWLAERKMNKARETLKAIQKKYGIADPDKAEYLDTISALLSKWSKN